MDKRLITRLHFDSAGIEKQTCLGNVLISTARELPGSPADEAIVHGKLGNLFDFRVGGAL